LGSRAQPRRSRPAAQRASGRSLRIPRPRLGLGAELDPWLQASRPLPTRSCCVEEAVMAASRSVPKRAAEYAISAYTLNDPREHRDRRRDTVRPGKETARAAPLGRTDEAREPSG